ncbi:hypothetical protein Micbo1qcDRAFT_186539 [Microdochium bolleyi]|uniref:CCD97-like C-terminal domain-containing protein n=1 Tax=Microdochium bolleyi TaxID=196109 RepID=A0A136IKZ4_9PEZI|nr:hypothetical protein Micbo1qcDRAFT_186539 [Microdochium bolleyi]
MGIHLSVSPASPPFAQPRPRAPRSLAQSAQVQVRNHPLLYHEFIRRFQSPEDREKEGRKKGYSCVLEVDLLRGEAKLTRARAANNHSRQADGHGHATSTNGITQPPPPPGTNGEGRERWRDFLRRRFVLGRDDDFDYRSVDENDDLDALERRDTVEAWFDDEVPGWASDRPEQDDSGDHTMHGAGAQKLAGETGIQDF